MVNRIENATKIDHWIRENVDHFTCATYSKKQDGRMCEYLRIFNKIKY